MQTLKKGMLLAVVLALAASGISVGAARAASDQPAAGAALQAEGDAWLGVSIADTPDGVSIVEIVSGSPADDAGLRVGDVITAVDSVDVESADALVDLIATYAPGDEVTVTAEYRGVSNEYTVTLGERPSDLELRRPNVEIMPRFGMSGTFDLFGLRAELTDDGLVIEAIADDSPFANSGLQAGDVITQVNGEDISADMGAGLLRSFRVDEPLRLTVERDGEEITVEVDLVGMLPDIELPDIELPDIDLPDVESWRGMGLGFGSMVAGMLGLDAELTDEGLVINEISDGSPLADTELQAGDVIVAVNDLSLTDFEPGAIV
ncbi:MAG: PDZ domain-containing protein, partial [Chloroflexi bacterium]|nr:PDZ domain-containing protein [Chloroflexota bacterium]